MTLQRRTPMPRGKPLARGKGLDRGRPLDRARAPLPAKSKKQSARDRTIDQAIAEAKARDGYQCQAKARGIVPEVECLGRLEGQHIIPRGVRSDLAADVSNIVTLCLAHHQWAGEHPIAAREVGLHGFQGDRPWPAT